MFQRVHPIIGTRDLARAIAFYTDKLGFTLAFRDNENEPNYVGFRRDAVELHMQFQFDHEMSQIRLRLVVEDPDGLFAEYRAKGSPAGLSDTSWGTREFALAPDGRGGALFVTEMIVLPGHGTVPFGSRAAGSRAHRRLARFPGRTTEEPASHDATASGLRTSRFLPRRG